jgi:hypothetical protein
MKARECYGIKGHKQRGNGTRPDAIIKEEKRKYTIR